MALGWLSWLSSQLLISAQVTISRYEIEPRVNLSRALTVGSLLGILSRPLSLSAPPLHASTCSLDQNKWTSKKKKKRVAHSTNWASQASLNFTTIFTNEWERSLWCDMAYFQEILINENSKIHRILRLCGFPVCMPIKFYFILFKLKKKKYSKAQNSICNMLQFLCKQKVKRK